MKKSKPDTQAAATLGSDLTQELETAQKQTEELKEKLARALADYQNLQKRTQQQQAIYIKLATVPLLEKVVGILDHLETAAEHVHDSGLDMVVTQFKQVLTDEGVTVVDPTGEPFDPETMECTDQVEGPKDHVTQVVQKGYRLNDYLIRPARVYVGVGETNKN